jgi:DNA-binding PadR family transcriptional regulator
MSQSRPDPDTDKQRLIAVSPRARQRSSSQSRREIPSSQQPAEHALLGLLALAGGTAHGYELARQFRRGQPLGEVIRLEPAMLYKHLKKLATLDWLRMTVEEQQLRPPRQMCHLTPAGETELRRWLSEPVAHTREVRLEFLVKLYFARQLDPALATRLAEEQRGVMLQLAESLTAQLEELAPDGVTDDTTFRRLVLELRLQQTHAAAGWLAHVADMFRLASAETVGETQERPAPPA